MISTSFIHETAINDLVKSLPSLEKHNYNTIDKLMRKVASKHKLTADALHKLFVRKYRRTPDDWVNHHKKHGLSEEGDGDLNLESEVDKFVQWACARLNIKTVPEIELSQDTEEAQTNHHTGGHQPGESSIWVYAKNRNLVDILRTVFHELVHIRQGELNMIKPGSSYPGSPIEAMADMLAGKYIKIYGEQNHHIFQ